MGIIDLIFLLLLLVFCVSAACLLGYAIPNLQQEKQALEGCKASFFNIKDTIAERERSTGKGSKGARGESDAYLEFLEFFKRITRDAQGQITEVRHFSNATELPGAITLGSKGNEGLRSSYISDRLFVILCSVSTANLVRKTPSLTDLHELTQQQEQGELSTACARVLTPSMLVIGILGTLFGVHVQLGQFDAKVGIEQLASALGPGIMAVLGTIICIVLRGWYQRSYAAYTTQLNEFTLKHLLPFFRPKGEIQTDIETFKEMMRGIIKLDYDALGENIAEYQQAVNNCHRVCCDLPKLYDDCIAQLSSLVRSIQTILRQWNEARKRTDDAYATYTHLNRRFSELSQQVSKRITAFDAALRHAPDPGEELAAVLRHLQSVDDAYGQRMGTAFRAIRDHLTGTIVPDLVAMVEQSESLRQWLRSGLRESEARYREAAAPIAGTLREMGEQMHKVSQNGQIIVYYLRDFKQELANVHPRVTRSREERVSMWRDVAARLRHWREKYEQGWLTSTRVGSYPQGWPGIHMRLRDAIACARSIFYHDWSGRACGMALIIAFLLFLYYV